MKKVFLQMPNALYEQNMIFKRKVINDANFRWNMLKEKLGTMGFELVTADDRDLNDCEGIIFHDAFSIYGISDRKTQVKTYLKKLLGLPSAPIYPTRKLYAEAVEAGLKDKMILLITEGRTVCPQNFLPDVLEKFNKILTWDDDLLKNPKFSRAHFSMEPHETIEKAIPFHEKKLLTNISTNKYSPYKNELYSARRKTAAYFDRHYPNDFDMYGTRWNIPLTRTQRLFPFLVKKYATFRGKTQDKVETLSRYKFNICYENNSDAKGYITEKIFDSLRARTVPIYWGASNIEKYVNIDAFIDRRKFRNDKELADFITKMDEEQYSTYLEAGTRYMESEEYTEFLPETFCDRVIDALKLTS